MTQKEELSLFSIWNISASIFFLRYLKLHLFLRNNFLHTTLSELAMLDAMTLLKEAGQVGFNTVFLTEFEWFEKFYRLSASERQKYEVVRSNEHRKLSSYFYFLYLTISEKNHFLPFIQPF